MGIGSVSGGISQVIQMSQLDRQLGAQVSQRAQLQQQKAEATISSILNNKIEAQQQALKAANQGLKGSSINVYA